jgi:hypothetical protein
MIIIAGDVICSGPAQACPGVGSIQQLRCRILLESFRPVWFLDCPKTIPFEGAFSDETQNLLVLGQLLYFVLRAI